MKYQLELTTTELLLVKETLAVVRKMPAGLPSFSRGEVAAITEEVDEMIQEELANE